MCINVYRMHINTYICLLQRLMVAIKQLLMVNHEIEAPEGGGLSLSNPTSTVASSRSFTTFDTGKLYAFICIHV
jgi:hypothetical protein